MSDLLHMGFINSLPHPLLAKDLGCDAWWPIHDIDVETALVRIDVCGLLQVKHISDVGQLKDADGIAYSTDDFYSEAHK